MRHQNTWRSARAGTITGSVRKVPVIQCHGWGGYSGVYSVRSNGAVHVG